jgi:RNA polymerase sigma factor (sigma-70 family)
MPRVDATLIAEMLDRHGAALALYAGQWTAQADDCVQEALVELARQPKPPENPVAWLYQVVRNRALNASRASRRRTAREKEAAERRQARSDSTAAAEIHDALLVLEPIAREIVVLRIWGGLAWQEIAEVTGVSKSSAQRNYVQSLEELRKHWEPDSCATK